MSEGKPRTRRNGKRPSEAEVLRKMEECLHAYAEERIWVETPPEAIRGGDGRPAGYKSHLDVAEYEARPQQLDPEVKVKSALVKAALWKVQPLAADLPHVIVHWHSMRSLKGYRFVRGRSEVAKAVADCSVCEGDVVLIWWHKLWVALKPIVEGHPFKWETTHSS